MRKLGAKKTGLGERPLDAGETGGCGSVQDGRWIERGNEDTVQMDRVSWDGTGRDWEGRVCDRKAPGEAAGEPRGIWQRRGEGVCAGGMVARQSPPDDTRCVWT